MGNSPNFPTNRNNEASAGTAASSKPSLDHRPGLGTAPSDTTATIHKEHKLSGRPDDGHKNSESDDDESSTSSFRDAISFEIAETDALSFDGNQDEEYTTMDSETADERHRGTNVVSNTGAQSQSAESVGQDRQRQAIAEDDEDDQDQEESHDVVVIGDNDKSYDHHGSESDSESSTVKSPTGLKSTREEEEQLMAESKLLVKIPRKLAWFNGAGRLDNSVLQGSRLRVRKNRASASTGPSQSQTHAQLHRLIQQKQPKRLKLNTSRERQSSTLVDVIATKRSPPANCDDRLEVDGNGARSSAKSALLSSSNETQDAIPLRIDCEAPLPGDSARLSSTKKRPGSMDRRRRRRSLKDAAKGKGPAGTPRRLLSLSAKIDEFDFDQQDPMDAHSRPSMNVSEEVDNEFSFDRQAKEDVSIPGMQKKKPRKIFVVGSCQHTTASQSKPASHSPTATSQHYGSDVPLQTKTASIANRDEDLQHPKKSVQSTENANGPPHDLDALNVEAALSAATTSEDEGSEPFKRTPPVTVDDLANDNASLSSENSESLFQIARTDNCARLSAVATDKNGDQEAPPMVDFVTQCSFFYASGGKQCPDMCVGGALFCSVHANSYDPQETSEPYEMASKSRPMHNVQDSVGTVVATATGDLSSEDEGARNGEYEMQPFPVAAFGIADANSDCGSSDKSDFEDDEDNLEDATIKADADKQSCENGVYTGSEYNKLFRMCERKFGNQLEEIEDGNPIRAANQNVENSDSTWQNRAQYGRLLPKANKKLMKILEVRKEDIFLDIGHGVGNSCFYAAFCIGCNARGLELVENRFNVSDLFKEQLELFNRRNENRPVGTIALKLGRLEDPANERFQTENVTRVYVNNFNGVFSERSDVRKVGVYPDHVVAGLFTKLAVGSIMVTFYPLPLGPDQNKANELRCRAGLEESYNASFFKEEKVSLGLARDCVRWGTKETSCDEMIWVYKYTRLEQTVGGGAAVFLCSNARCQYAREATPIEATGEDDEGRCISRKHCPACCTSAHATRTLRKQKHQFDA